MPLLLLRLLKVLGAVCSLLETSLRCLIHLECVRGQWWFESINYYFAEDLSDRWLKNYHTQTKKRRFASAKKARTSSMYLY